MQVYQSVLTFLPVIGETATNHSQADDNRMIKLLSPADMDWGSTISGRCSSGKSGHDYSAQHCITVSGDGSMIATSYYEDRVHIWQTSTGHCLSHSIVVHGLNTFQFSSNSQSLLVSSQDHFLETWNVQSPQCPVFIGSATSTYKVCLWSKISADCSWVLHHSTDRITPSSINYAPSHWLQQNSGSKQCLPSSNLPDSPDCLALYNVASGIHHILTWPRFPAGYATSRTEVVDACFSPDNSSAVITINETGGYLCRTLVFSMRPTPCYVATLDMHASLDSNWKNMGSNHVFLHDDSRRLLCCHPGSSSSVAVFSTEAWCHIGKISPQEITVPFNLAPVHGMPVLAGLSRVINKESNSAKMMLWNVDTNTIIAVGPSVEGDTLLAVSPTGTTVAVAASQTELTIWDASKELASGPDQLFSDPIVNIAFQDSGVLIAFLTHKTVALWSITTAEATLHSTWPLPLIEEELTATCLAFSPQQPHLAALVHGTIFIWDVTNGQVVHTAAVVLRASDRWSIEAVQEDTVEDPRLTAPANLWYLPNGTRLIGVYADTLVIWDTSPLSNTREIAQIDIHRHGIATECSLFASSDGFCIIQHLCKSMITLAAWDAHSGSSVELLDDDHTQAQSFSNDLNCALSKSGWLQIHGRNIGWIPFECRPEPTNGMSRTLRRKGNIVAMGSAKGKVTILRIQGFQFVHYHYLKGHELI